MKYVSVKRASDIALKGIKVEFDHEDKTLKRVTFTDGAGNSVVVTRGESYSSDVRVLLPQPLEPATRFKLSGTFLGMAPVAEYFEYQHEADARKAEYDEKAGHRGSGLTIGQVNVLLNEDGAVVKECSAGEVADATRQLADADIPF